MRKDEARKAVGGLSKPAKMPCYGFSLAPGKSCPNGAKLSKLCGSVCSACYGKRNNYVTYRDAIGKAWNNRMAATLSDDFADLMVIAIGKDKYFRWHDTGDVYSLDYWRKIVDIAERLPNTMFWLPTKEYKLRTLARPDNLLTRFSVPLINSTDERVLWYAERFSHIATVSQWPEARLGFRCTPVLTWDKSRGGYVSKCGDCRACWLADEPIIDYALH